MEGDPTVMSICMSNSEAPVIAHYHVAVDEPMPVCLLDDHN
jgi:hypothetical protein